MSGACRMGYRSSEGGNKFKDNFYDIWILKDVFFNTKFITRDHSLFLVGFCNCLLIVLLKFSRALGYSEDRQ